MKFNTHIVFAIQEREYRGTGQMYRCEEGLMGRKTNIVTYAVILIVNGGLKMGYREGEPEGMQVDLYTISSIRIA